jgi:acyl-CoA dehydrogenase
MGFQSEQGAGEPGRCGRRYLQPFGDGRCRANRFAQVRRRIPADALPHGRASANSRIPEEYGGSGLGILEAGLMMRAIAESGAGMSGASSIHMNIFGLNPVVVFGTDEQKRRILPPLARGEERSCFAVTEPDAGLNTTRLKTRARRDGDSYVVDGQKVWISSVQSADKMLLLARTTPLDEVRKPTHGLSLFYTTIDRTRVEVREIEKMRRKAVDSNQVFFDGFRIPTDGGLYAKGYGADRSGIYLAKLSSKQVQGSGIVALGRADRLV